MNQFISIHITTPDEATAKKIGRELVKLKLVACAQIEGPITSIYNWKNKLEEDQEWCLVLKSNLENYKEIEKFVSENHPYDTPQILAIPIVKISSEYGHWIQENFKTSIRDS